MPGVTFRNKAAVSSREETKVADILVQNEHKRLGWAARVMWTWDNRVTIC